MAHQDHRLRVNVGTISGHGIPQSLWIEQVLHSKTVKNFHGLSTPCLMVDLDRLELNLPCGHHLLKPRSCYAEEFGNRRLLSLAMRPEYTSARSPIGSASCFRRH